MRIAPIAALALLTAAPASAAYGIELNGTYSVLSNGDWAKTGDVTFETGRASCRERVYHPV